MTAQFHRRSFIWSMGLCILLIMNIGMSLMFVSIVLGMPLFISMAALMGGIFLGIGLLAGEATYTVDAFGLRQQIGPLRWFTFVSKKIDRYFAWKDIVWVQEGTDLNRSYGEYKYIKIKLAKWPYSLKLSSDSADLKAYENFCDALNNYIGNSSKSTNLDEKSTSKPNVISDEFELEPKITLKDKPRIKIKPDFYSTRKARVIFYFLCIVFLGLIGLMYTTGIFKITYAFRFLIIIIPGMGYYYWRLFVRK